MSAAAASPRRHRRRSLPRHAEGSRRCRPSLLGRGDQAAFAAALGGRDLAGSLMVPKSTNARPGWRVFRLRHSRAFSPASSIAPDWITDFNNSLPPDHEESERQGKTG